MLGGNGLVAWAGQFMPSGVLALLLAASPLFMVLVGWAWSGGTRRSTRVLVGLLRIFMDHPINDVNASIIAGERGIEVSEIKRHKGRDLTSAIAVTARAGGRTRLVQGTLFHVGERVDLRGVAAAGEADLLRLRPLFLRTPSAGL